MIQRSPHTIRSLGTQIALVFGGFAAALALLLCLVAGELLRLRLQQQAGQALQLVAHTAATMLHQDLQQQSRRAQVLASSPELWEQGLGSRPVAQLLNRMQSINPYSVWIRVTDPQGTVLNATGGVLKGSDVSQRPWFREALRGPFISEVHQAPQLAQLLPQQAQGEALKLIDFSAPIHHPEGALLGVIGIQGSWDWVRDTVEHLLHSDDKHKQQSLFIFDSQKRLIYAPDGVLQPFTDLDQTLPDAIDLVRLTPKVVNWLDQSTPFLTAAVRLPPPDENNDPGWWIVARQPEDAAYADANRVLWLGLGLGLVTGLLAALVAWRLARHVSEDLKHLALAASQVQSQPAQAQIPVLFSNREVFRLSRALDAMTRDLLQANESMHAQVRLRTQELEHANAELERLASTDPLTGLLNRRGFDEKASLAMALAGRSGRPLSVLTIDIDFFKHVNDQHGHEAGDRVLVHLADTLRQRSRKTDVLARFGGEEFVVLLPDTDGDAAYTLATHLLQTIAHAEVPLVGHLTISIGLSSLRQHDATDGLSEMLHRSDAALYTAKRTGRNRVCREP